MNDHDDYEDEVEAHSVHGRMYFGGADCLCPKCTQARGPEKPEKKSRIKYGVSADERAAGGQVCANCFSTRRHHRITEFEKCPDQQTTYYSPMSPEDMATRCSQDYSKLRADLRPKKKP